MLDAKNKYQDIAVRIRDLIAKEALDAGSKLPTERELSERFGVSRATVRAAEIQLQTEGCIEIKPGSGAYVVETQAASAADLPNVTALELTEARMLLESEGAALAAVHITDRELQLLGTFIDVMNNTSPEDDAVAEEADRDFHLTIARASGNAVLLHTVQMFWRIRSEVAAVKEVYEAVCKTDTAPRGKEHSDILEALTQRDPGKSRIAMRAHFFRLLESMVDVFTARAIEEAHQRADKDRQRFLLSPALPSSKQPFLSE
ncbi:MAG: FCD domain-containing protein [Gammaproteobacteria bacterium]|nr:FCD domain-containing protein [Gammaproteobacteria bacterium]